MTELQTVSGFFDNTAEAQQAVQHLLAQGFNRKTVEFLTRPGQHPTPSQESNQINGGSGRFLDTLFGNQTSVLLRAGALISVHAQPALEANRVADMLYQAGAEDVFIDVSM